VSERPRGRATLFAVPALHGLADSGKTLEAVTPHHQRRIERAAGAFLSQHPKWSNLGFRFDVMAVTPWRRPKHVTDAWRPEAE